MSVRVRVVFVVLFVGGAKCDERSAAATTHLGCTASLLCCGVDVDRHTRENVTQSGSERERESEIRIGIHISASLLAANTHTEKGGQPS